MANRTVEIDIGKVKAFLQKKEKKRFILLTMGLKLELN